MSARAGNKPAAPPPVRVLTQNVVRPSHLMRGEAVYDPMSVTQQKSESGMVVDTGGELLQKFIHPGIDTFERVFQSLPEEGMFQPGLSPTNPFQFTVGSYTVPQSMTLWLEDYETAVLLPDPINAGDYRFAEDGRFSGNLGFDLTVADGRSANITYQLDPVPISAARQEFETVVVTPGNARTPPVTARFNRALAMSFGSAAGSGSSLQPPRRRPAGPRSRSFTWQIHENQTITVRCVVFRRVLTPLSGIYAMLGGHLMHRNIATALQNRTKTI